MKNKEERTFDLIDEAFENLDDDSVIRLLTYCVVAACDTLGISFAKALNRVRGSLSRGSAGLSTEAQKRLMPN